MRKSTKIWLIAAACLVLIGCIMFGGVMSMLKWDFTKLSTVKYETNNYEIFEDYQNISIVTDTADIVFVPSETGETTVVCYEPEHTEHSVTVTDSTLIISVQNTRKWYEHISLSFSTPKITVSMPRGEYGMLLATASTGNVEIPECFKFETMGISENTGNVTVFSPVLGAVSIKGSTGAIRVENITAGALNLSVTTGSITVSNIDCKGDATFNVSTGKTVLTDLTCKNVISHGDTGSLRMTNVVAAGSFRLSRSTGDIQLDGSDAAEIFVQTDTGNVTGTLLSEKVFITQTDTGRVRVPNTASGGTCEIRTDTGDIKLDIH